MRERAGCMVSARLSWLRIVSDLVHFLCLGLRSGTSLAAENLFLRKQLAFYEERKVKPRRADCTSSGPSGQVSNGFKRGSGPSELKLRLQSGGAAGVVARWFSAWCFPSVSGCFDHDRSRHRPG